MAMNVGSSEGDEELNSSINTTPLVDVMLVLLIIFLITIPVVTHTVPLTLPKETNQPQQTKPQNITLSVTRDGDIYWGTQSIADIETLVGRLKTVAQQEPQPEIQIRGDQDTRWEFLGKVMMASQRAGFIHVSFITEPPPKG
jgi:biopolymer transport protein ExbD